MTAEPVVTQPVTVVEVITAGPQGGPAGGPGLRGRPVDTAVIRTLGDFLANLSKTHNLHPEGVFDVDADGNGIANGWTTYNAVTGSLVPRGSGNAQRLVVAPGVNSAIVSTPQPCPEVNVPYVVSAELSVLALEPGANCNIVLECHDLGGAVLDYTYVTTAVVTAGYVIVQATVPAPTGTVSLQAKVEINGGGTVEIDNLITETGTVRTIKSPADSDYITVHSDQTIIRPYKANFAAMGLLDAYRYVGDQRYLTAAVQWLHWYRDHMDPVTGFVEDYDIVAGELVATGDMDSTDSYAATYLNAVEMFWRTTHALDDLEDFRDSISLAVDAIKATLQDSGPCINLTWAKPTFTAAYLMDNCEVVAGLRSAGYLLTVLDDAVGAADAYDTCDIVLAGIESLWDDTAQSYIWAVHESNGARIPTDWADYNGALQNVWAVAFGIATGDRAVGIMQAFGTAHPTWFNAEPPFYWHGIPVWAYQRTNNPNAVNEALDGLLDAAATTAPERYAYPFDALAAGTIALAVTGSGVEYVGIGSNLGLIGGVAGSPGPRGFSGPATTALTPTDTADAVGREGQVAYDDAYVYVKTAAGWRRAALASF